jgi:hypothetical protein
MQEVLIQTPQGPSATLQRLPLSESLPKCFSLLGSLSSEFGQERSETRLVEMQCYFLDRERLPRAHASQSDARQTVRKAHEPAELTQPLRVDIPSMPEWSCGAHEFISNS